MLVSNDQAVSENIFKTFFGIGFYIKTISTDVGCLGWLVGLSDIIMKGDHLRTIPTKSDPIGQAISGEKIFKTFFPYGPMLKLSVDVGHLGWRAGVMGLNSERGPAKDHFSKVGPTDLAVSKKKIFKTFFHTVLY